MKKVGDPATRLPIGGTDMNLKAAIAGETHEYTDTHPSTGCKAPHWSAITRIIPPSAR